MRLIEKTEEMRNLSQGFHADGLRVSLVPTLGWLHSGHLSLCTRAKEVSDVAVVSIFVNPTQFGAGEDYLKYPRDTGRDAALAEKIGVDVIFCPGVEEIYPEGYSTYVEVTGLQDGLCGAFRPGHFRGVATVCLKLFNIVGPDVVVFGQKDAQQAVIIQRMIEDLSLPIEMVTVPTVREPDGLAVSSRNGYLSAEERREATVLHEALEYARSLVRAGERDSGKIVSEMTQLIEEKPLARIEYVEVVDARDLKTVDSLRGDVLIAVACWFGKARLIDNLSLKIPADDRF